ncbi:MAG: CoA transferase [Actinobacteria bacterium]|nr:CoA transferase [Actinomycetota bacterium]
MGGLLEGIRVLDFTGSVSGPACSMFLADAGAEVIKIERPLRGDDSRLFPPFKEGWSGSYVTLQRGKKGIALNLKESEGVEIFRELVKISDVVVENMTPGTMAKLGLDYEHLKALKDDIILCSISGYGQTGPLSPLPGYDSVIQAMSGIMSITGFPHGPPTRVGSLISDISSAVFGAMGICMALFYREKTGKGNLVDVSMFDVSLTLLDANMLTYTIEHQEPVRNGNRLKYITPFDTFRCSDGDVLIICGNETNFGALADAIGRPELREDPRFVDNPSRTQHEPELKPIIEEWTSPRTREEVLGVLLPVGVPVAPVNRVSEAIEMEQTRVRGMLQDVEQPGAGTMTICGPTLKVPDTPLRIAGPAPMLGEHTREILADLLGYGEERLADLQEKGVI